MTTQEPVFTAPACGAAIGPRPYHFCSKPATWYVEWSDRSLYVCTEHRDEVRRSRDGESDGDRVGIFWTDADGKQVYEP